MARPPRPAEHVWLDAAIAVVVVLALALDHMWLVWSAGAPWVAGVFQGIVVSPSVGALVLLVVVGWRLLPAELGRWEPTGAKIAAGPGAILLLCLALSASVAIAPLLSLARLGDVALGLLASWTIAHRPALARALVVGCSVLVVAELPFALLQEATQSTFPFERIVYGQPQEITAAMSGAPVVLTPGGTRWERAMGLFLHPNLLGGFLAVTLVLGLVWLAPRPRFRWALLAVWVVGWLELGLSFSRAALLAALLGCAAYAVGRWRRPRDRRTLAVLLGGATVAALVALALTGPVLLRWMMLRPSLLGGVSATQRGIIDGVGLALVRAHPLLGVGAGNFSLATLQPPFDAIMVDPAHAVPLLVAAEAGILAGLAWLALVLATPVAAWRRGDRRIFWEQSAIVLALLTLAMLDHYLWSLPTGRAIFWIVLGIAAANVSRAEVAT